MIAAFVNDLLFQSKIRAAASHSGAAVSFVRDPADPSLAGATLAIVDLDGPGAVAAVSALAAARPALRLVGFVSHVNADRIREARAAGTIEVMARSAFVSALPSLLADASLGG
jgi:hypothetical protein